MDLYILAEVSELEGAAYWVDAVVNLIIELIPAVITALLAAYVLDRAFKKSKRLGDSLVKSGIDNIEYANGKMKKRDQSILFGLNHRNVPVEVCLCFLTGDNFFLDYYNKLLNLLNHNCEVNILIANPFESKRSKTYLEKYPTSFDREKSLCKEDDKKQLGKLYYEYYLNKEKHNDLCYLERTYLMVSKDEIEEISESEYNLLYDELDDNQKLKVWEERVSKTGDHVMQAVLVTKIVESLNEKSTGSKINLKYYKDEYRIPIILAKFQKDFDEEVFLWTNMNAPVQETTKSVNVFGKATDETDTSYITDVMKTFDYLFGRY